MNAQLFYKNQDTKTYISIVPTSAHTSDGIGNLMALIVEFSQTILSKRVSYSTDLQCTVMEVKAIPGLGTTIDACLVNGKLAIADTIIIAGQEGPIVTQVRGLLTPQPNRDLRVKNNYVQNKQLLGATGVKIIAKDLEKCLAGLPLFVAQKEDEIEFYKEELSNMLKQVLSSIKLSDTGVFVQASTLGSLEALLEFLRTSKIPYAGISIGPIHKKDVTMASIMLEKDPQYAVILAFDVKVERDAQDMADHVGVKIFTADIIYHLFDKFIGYRDELKLKKREEFKDIAVFPFKIKILPEFIFNTRDPIIVGVKIESGFIKMNSPICAMCEDQNAEREGKEVGLFALLIREIKSKISKLYY
jgi:translation initiation factor 5B